MLTMTITEVVEGKYARRRAAHLARCLRAQEGCTWVRVDGWRFSARYTVTAGGFQWPSDVPTSAMPDGCTPVYV